MRMKRLSEEVYKAAVQQMKNNAFQKKLTDRYETMLTGFFQGFSKWMEAGNNVALVHPDFDVNMDARRIDFKKIDAKGCLSFQEIGSRHHAHMAFLIRIPRHEGSGASQIFKFKMGVVVEDENFYLAWDDGHLMSKFTLFEHGDMDAAYGFVNDLIVKTFERWSWNLLHINGVDKQGIGTIQDPRSMALP